MSSGVVAVVGQLQDAQVARAQIDMASLSSALDMHYLIKGRRPQFLSELADSRVVEREPSDPWGHEFIYRSPGTEGRSFDLLSAGPDGLEGTEDDVQFVKGKR